MYGKRRRWQRYSARGLQWLWPCTQDWKASKPSSASSSVLPNSDRGWLRLYLAFAPVGTLIAVVIFALLIGVWPPWGSRADLEFTGKLVPPRSRLLRRRYLDSRNGWCSYAMGMDTV